MSDPQLAKSFGSWPVGTLKRKEHRMPDERCPSCGYEYGTPTMARSETERAYYNRNPCCWCGRDAEHAGKDPWAKKEKTA